MDWIEVKIYTTSEGIEPVTGLLLGLGINGMIVDDPKDLDAFLASPGARRWDYVDDELLARRNAEASVRVFLPEDDQGRGQLTRLAAALAELRKDPGSAAYGRLEWELANVRDEDWANNWKAYFKPFPVGESLVIKPTWEEWDKEDGRIILEIDPGSSFGTGQHHTTRLCLELLESYTQPGDRILDLGCGSGILFIAALLLGAEKAWAADIEEHSARAAAENAAQNGIASPRYTTAAGDIISDESVRRSLGWGEKSYDLVCANIVADVILGMAPYFNGYLKDGGTLLVSGIIDDRLAETRQALEDQGFRLIKGLNSADWNAMAFQKKEVEENEA